MRLTLHQNYGFSYPNQSTLSMEGSKPPSLDLFAGLMKRPFGLVVSGRRSFCAWFKAKAKKTPFRGPLNTPAPPKTPPKMVYSSLQQGGCLCRGVGGLGSLSVGCELSEPFSLSVHLSRVCRAASGLCLGFESGRLPVYVQKAKAYSNEVLFGLYKTCHGWSLV